MNANTEANHFVIELMRMGKQLEDILKAANHYPESPILQLYAAVFFLYAQTSEGKKKSISYLKAAKKLKMDSCEKSLYRSLIFWSKGDMLAALGGLEQHCASWPQDQVAIKLIEFLFYCGGQEYCATRFLKVTKSSYRYLEKNPHFLSIHAFALGLNGFYEKSRQVAEFALELESQNPWAYHTLAHYYLNKKEIDKGIMVLKEGMPHWKKSAPSIVSHNLWHLALLYLENLDFTAVFDVFKKAKWNKKALLVGEKIDATSLLWRLDMHGQKTEKFWKVLATAMDTCTVYPATPFIAAHVVYALKRGGKKEALEKVFLQIRRNLSCASTKQAAQWKKLGNSLITASLAFADQDHEQVVKLLHPIFTGISTGGSDVEMALFQQMFFCSLNQIGHNKSTREIMRAMMTSQKTTLRDSFFLAPNKIGKN